MHNTPGSARVQSGRPKNSKKNLPAFVTRLLTPRSQKSGYGLLLGWRLGLNAGREKKDFFNAFPPHQKTVKSSSDSRARHRNRLSVVELVGREPWIIARVENGVTKFSPKRQKPKTPFFSKKNWIRNNSFQWGIFNFTGCAKMCILLQKVVRVSKSVLFG